MMRSLSLNSVLFQKRRYKITAGSNIQDVTVSHKIQKSNIKKQDISVCCQEALTNEGYDHNY